MQTDTDFVIYVGETIRLEMALYEPDERTRVDVDGNTFKMTCKNEAAEHVIVGELVAGSSKVHIPITAINAEAGEWKYKLMATNADGKVRLVTYGRITAKEVL